MKSPDAPLSMRTCTGYDRCVSMVCSRRGNSKDDSLVHMMPRYQEFSFDRGSTHDLVSICN